jgi:hypothetical protein
MILADYGTLAIVSAFVERHGYAPGASYRDAGGILVPSRTWGEQVAATMGRAVAIVRDASGPVVGGVLDDARAELARQQIWMLDRARAAFVGGFDIAGQAALVLARRIAEAIALLGTAGGDAIAAITLPLREEWHRGQWFGLAVLVLLVGAGVYVLGTPGAQLAIAAQGAGAARSWPILTAGLSRATASVGAGSGSAIAALGTGGGKALVMLPGLIPTAALR